ncbi:hypothetical protein MES5069_510041 [Mesorhizobium escarrei]|uniref:Uncharacterized protein n=1 Tax=Mesorhizobium escarrei TaxID=666018 RepID=A0ABN8K745_9HYPH|nr:hypothetical protein MES5069_510041 [Mesorhizobium escarrei]
MQAGPAILDAVPPQNHCDRQCAGVHCWCDRSGVAWPCALQHRQRYQGEFTFLARLEKPLAIVEPPKLKEWLQNHPSGYSMTKAIRYPDNTRSVAPNQLVKNGYLVVLSGNHPAKVSMRWPVLRDGYSSTISARRVRAKA